MEESGQLQPARDAGLSSNSIRIEESQIYLARELAAKKNKEQFVSRVQGADGASRRKNRYQGTVFTNLNSSKDIDEFAEQTSMARKAAIESSGGAS